jgi:hypothetical protein
MMASMTKRKGNVSVRAATKVIALCVVWLVLYGFPLRSMAAISWQQMNTNGFGYPDRSDYGTELFSFSDRLYARNSDGLFLMNGTDFTWSQISIPGSPAGPGGDAFLSGPHGDYFYAKAGSQVWRLATGNELSSGAWETIATTGPADPPLPMVLFKGQLYATVFTASNTFEIWRTTDIDSTTMHWSRVVENSFGDPTNNQYVSMVRIYKDALYLGTDTLNGTFGDPGDYGDGVEIWRSETGHVGSWTQINIDGFGTLSAGCFNEYCDFPTNQVIGSAVVFQSRWDHAERLYVGTKSHQGAEVWAFNGSSWENVTPPWAGVCELGCWPGRNEDMEVHKGFMYVAEGFPTANLAKFDGRHWYIEEEGPFPFEPANDRLLSLESFFGNLYVSAKTTALELEQHGDQIWGFFPPNRYVSKVVGQDAGNCHSAPCQTIQYALNQLNNGNSIWIARGTYQENLTVPSNTMGITLDGGWDDEFKSRIDNPDATVIDGSSSGRALFVDGSSGSVDATLRNLTVTQGVAPGGLGGDHGGGISLVADGNGANLLGHVATLSLERAIVHSNASSLLGLGGGIWVEASNGGFTLLDMTRSTVRHNVAISGGGIFGGSYSGGSYRINATNSFITNNHALLDGAGLFGNADGIDAKGEILLTNTTVTENDAGNAGGGIFAQSLSDGHLAMGQIQGVAWGNVAGGDDHADDIFLMPPVPGSTLLLFSEYSDVGALSGTGNYDDRGGNVSVDPGFVMPRPGYYFLDATSPLIDAAPCGVFTPAPDLQCIRKAADVDYSGQERPSGCLAMCEMGADEYVATPADTEGCELQDILRNFGMVATDTSCLAAKSIAITGAAIVNEGLLKVSVIQDMNTNGYISLHPGFDVADGIFQADVVRCETNQVYVAGLGCLP